MTAFGTAIVMPHQGMLWLVARLMLDAAGGFFGIYLVIGFVLSLTGGIVRFRSRLGAARLSTRK